METQELHRGRLIDHVQLVVRDLPASRRFYDAVFDVLQVPLGGTLDDGAFWYDELFVSNAESEAALGQLTGRHHLAFQAKDRAMVDAFHKAALYDESQATLAEARTKVREGVRPPTPGSDSDEGDRRKSEPRSVQARRRLAQTGSIEDAARVIELEMIEEREEREGAGRKPRRNE